jgi:hypothetical protein
LLRSSGSCSDASGQPQPQRSGDGALHLMFPKIRSIPGPLRRSCLDPAPVPSFIRTNESNEGLCTFGRVQLKVISLINFLGFKSALVLFCFNLKVRVNGISRSQLDFTREPKMAQMPIFDRSLGWVAGG